MYRILSVAMALSLIGGGAARADQYLCTLTNNGREIFIAGAILIDIRQGLFAMVFDENVEEVYGEPIMAEVTESSAKRVQIAWMVELQKIRSRSGFSARTGARQNVFYYATLDKRTLGIRIRGKTGSAGNANAEGKCTPKK